MMEQRKMNLPRKCTAIKALLFAAWLLAATLAWAGQAAGTVTHLNGPLLAKKADGTVKVLARKSTVEEGDTLITEKNTYARIKFSDNSEITMRPNSQLKIESFAFDEARPEEDKASFDLVKGGLRAVTGILGKRNNERVTMKTPTATIGIRGTTYIAEYIPPEPAAVAAYVFASVAAVAPETSFPAHMTMTDAPQSGVPIEILPPLAQMRPPSSGPSLAPGLYVQVIDGIINLSNSGGAQNFSAGQFGFTSSFNRPPIIVPNNPGLKFTPPPAFLQSSGPVGGGSNSGSAADVDCEVR
jgi:hypothetical protein